jgi:phosphohistidine swiveling domain-containing protein
MNQVLELHEINDLTEDQREEAGIHTKFKELAEIKRATGVDSYTFMITPTAFEEFVQQNDIGGLEREVEPEELDGDTLRSIAEKERKLIRQSPVPRQTKQEIESLASRLDIELLRRIETEHDSRFIEGRTDIDCLLEKIKSAWTSLASEFRVLKRITAGISLHKNGDSVFVAEGTQERKSGEITVIRQEKEIRLFVRPRGRLESPDTHSSGHRGYREAGEEHTVDAETGRITDVRFVTGVGDDESNLEPLLMGPEADCLIELAETVRQETSVDSFGWVSDRYGRGVRLSMNKRGLSIEAPQREIPDGTNLAFPVLKGQCTVSGSAVGNVVFLESEDSSQTLDISFEDLLQKVEGIEGPYVFVIDELDASMLSPKVGAAVIAPNCRSLTGRASIGGREYGTPTVIDCEVSDLTEGDTVYVHESGDVYAVD